ncbi:MAG: hypothetical protein IJQ67_03430 [Bacilli bacterium]|nr:hypothetical protein [Bacilli bacterium]
MIWFIFSSAIIALLVFLTAGIFAIRFLKRNKKHKSYAVYIFGAGLILAAITMFVPIYWNDFFKEDVGGRPGRIFMGVIETIGFSLHNSFRLFILDGDFEPVQHVVEDIIRQEDSWSWFGYFYYAVSILIYVSAPLLTFAFIATIIRGFWVRLRLRRCIRSKNYSVYCFSELNRKSILLAESIYQENKEKKKKQKIAIIFCEVNQKEEDEDSDLVDRANEIDAILFAKEITSINFGKKNNNVKIIKDEKKENSVVETPELLESRKKKALEEGTNFLNDLRKNHELHEDTAKEKYDAFVAAVEGALSIKQVDEELNEFLSVIDRTRKDYQPADYIPPESRRRLSLFFMHTMPNDNIRHYYDLFKMLKEREDVSLYLFSTSPASELALNHLKPYHDDESQEVCRVQRRRVTIDTFFIYRYLYNEGTKIFDNIKYETKDGKKIISIVIVGLGMYGTQLLEALAWYCQMDGYYLKINAFDSDPLALEKFSGLCPELMDEKHNKKIIPGDAQYDITIHSGVPIKTKEFNKRLAEIKDASLAFTCLGGDDFNIEAAIELRVQFERNGLHPIINAIVQDTSDDITLDAINHKKQPYDITFIGDDEEAYSVASILGSELEEEAKRAHVEYSKTRAEVETAIFEFYMYEYNYLSSCATVIHRRAKIHCRIPGTDKPQAERSDYEKKVIELLEHKRWNAWMRSKGYIYSGSNNKSSRNDLGKKHHDIVPYEELTEDEKRKDSLVTF